jgi:hypothetical protein
MIGLVECVLDRRPEPCAMLRIAKTRGYLAELTALVGASLSHERERSLPLLRVTKRDERERHDEAAEYKREELAPQ